MVVNANGTVSEISASGFPTTINTTATFNAASSGYMTAAYDPASKKVGIVFGTSNQPRFVMGGVSGSTITFGTIYVLTSNALKADSFQVVYDASFDCFVVVYAYLDGNNTGYLVARHSGLLQDYVAAGNNNIGFYSETNIENYYGGDYTAVRAAYDVLQFCTVVAYRWNYPFNTMYVSSVTVNANNNYTVSGQYQIGTQGAANFPENTVYDSNSNLVHLSYKRSTGKYMRTLTQSGSSSITVGSEYTLPFTTNGIPLMTFDSNANKVVGGYPYWTGSVNLGYMFIVTYSSGSYSTTTPVAITNYTNAEINGISFDTVNNLIGINFRLGSPNRAFFTTATVSGNTFTFTGNAAQYADFFGQAPLVYDSAHKQFITTYQNYDNNSYGAYNTITPATSNNINFIGVSASSISSGATGTVVLRGGVAENLSSLTPASTYYVQADGSITTSSSNQKAGKALSSSKLLLTGLT